MDGSLSNLEDPHPMSYEDSNALIARAKGVLGINESSVPMFNNEIVHLVNVVKELRDEHEEGNEDRVMDLIMCIHYYALYKKKQHTEEHGVE